MLLKSTDEPTTFVLVVGRDCALTAQHSRTDKVAKQLSRATEFNQARCDQKGAERRGKRGNPAKWAEHLVGPRQPGHTQPERDLDRLPNLHCR